MPKMHQYLVSCKQEKMGKLSLENRGRLTGLVDGGMSLRAAARVVGCDHKTVSKWVTRRQQNGNLKDLPRSGRPRVTSAAQDASIINKAETNRCYTGKSI
jgi:transposase